MLFGKWLTIDRKDEDSLENTLGCVPKVQGAEAALNLSGKRTETRYQRYCVLFLSSPSNGLLFS